MARGRIAGPSWETPRFLASALHRRPRGAQGREARPLGRAAAGREASPVLVAHPARREAEPRHRPMAPTLHLPCTVDLEGARARGTSENGPALPRVRMKIDETR